jgi:hypothetical protein
MLLWVVQVLVGKVMPVALFLDPAPLHQIIQVAAGAVLAQLGEQLLQIIQLAVMAVLD